MAHPPTLSDVRAEFRETLFAHAAVGGYDTSDEDALFANAFAQTLAFGLLLTREAAALQAAREHRPTATVDRDAYRLLPDLAYPLLRATLRALTQDEILDLLGVAFDVLQDTVNVVDPSLMARRGDHDPILYFYEDFLEVFDERAKKRLGVFFTPVPVVRFMVVSVDVPQLYANPNFVSRHGPELLAAWGRSNVALYAMPSGTGEGPAVWVHGVLPDYHAFRGSYGGYAFPLWDRRRGPEADNLNPLLIQGLAAAYGRPVKSEEVFDAIVALLSATSYTRGFAWDLEESFAHVPFPADARVFANAVRVGTEIRALETFERVPAAGYRSARLAGSPTGVTLSVPPQSRAFLAADNNAGFVPLQDDQSLRLVNLPERVWQFAVSGYRVLPRWLSARNGQALDDNLQCALLEVAWRIEELLHWFTAADVVLTNAIATSLDRHDLGLTAPGTPDADAIKMEPNDAPERSV